MTSVTVGTADLRAALLAVAPHADPSPDFPPLHRIRLTADVHNVWVTATQRYTAALAIASTEDLEADEDVTAIDLSPTDVKEILAIFKPPCKDEPSDAALRIDAYDTSTTVTDVSGMFPGKALKLPKQPVEENFPDIAKQIHTNLDTADEGAHRVITDGHLLGLFGAAAKAYGKPLLIEPSGETTVLVIACGESFLGLLMPHKATDDEDDQLGAWRSNWHTRLLNRQGVTITRVPAAARG